MEKLSLKWIDDNGYVDVTELNVDEGDEGGAIQDLLVAMTAASYAQIQSATTMDRLTGFSPPAATAGPYDAADKLFVPYENGDKQYFVQVPAPKADVFTDAEKTDFADSRLAALHTAVNADTAGAYGTRQPAYRSRRRRKGLRR